MVQRVLHIFLLIISCGLLAVSGVQIANFFSPSILHTTSWQAVSRDFQLIGQEEQNSPNSQVLGVKLVSLIADQDEPLVATFNPTVTSTTKQGFLFDQYLSQNGSPLAGYGENFVTACKRYDTPSDCTLLIAIARVETNLCKTDISAKQFNCWGFGGAGANRIHFSSFPEAIDTITHRLKDGYGDRFFTDPEYGELYYCGGHCSNWGNHVQNERVRINNFFQNQGAGKLF